MFILDKVLQLDKVIFSHEKVNIVEGYPRIHIFLKNSQFIYKIK